MWRHEHFCFVRQIPCVHPTLQDWALDNSFKGDKSRPEGDGGEVSQKLSLDVHALYPEQQVVSWILDCNLIMSHLSKQVGKALEEHLHLPPSKTTKERRRLRHSSMQHREICHDKVKEVNITSLLILTRFALLFRC